MRKNKAELRKTENVAKANLNGGIPGWFIFHFTFCSDLQDLFLNSITM